MRALGKKGAASMKSVVAVTVGIVALVGVSIPVTIQTINDGNLSGLTATIVAFIPVFLALAGIVLVTTMMK